MVDEASRGEVVTRHRDVGGWDSGGGVVTNTPPCSMTARQGRSLGESTHGPPSYIPEIKGQRQSDHFLFQYEKILRIIPSIPH